MYENKESVWEAGFSRKLGFIQLEQKGKGHFQKRGVAQFPRRVSLDFFCPIIFLLIPHLLLTGFRHDTR